MPARTPALVNPWMTGSRTAATGTRTAAALAALVAGGAALTGSASALALPDLDLDFAGLDASFTSGTGEPLFTVDPTIDADALTLATTGPAVDVVDLSGTPVPDAGEVLLADRQQQQQTNPVTGEPVQPPPRGELNIGQQLRHDTGGPAYHPTDFDPDVFTPGERNQWADDLNNASGRPTNYTCRQLPADKQQYVLAGNC